MNSNGLNHFFRIVWNATKGAWQAVSEIAKGQGKSKSCKAARPALTAGAFVLVGAAALAALGQAQAADVLPTGGSVTAGSASISTTTGAGASGAAMTITQTTARMAADWQSFSIGQGNTVTFNQPSASSVALNRVLGADVSVIQGALKANGQVFLINPNGVLFTPTAQVNVGAIVASTLNMKTEDFMAGNYKFDSTLGNTIKGSAIINQGNITAVGDAGTGGTIALIAAKITNTGTLTAHQGNVLLGAGSKVTLDLGGPVKLVVEQGAIDALIESGGAIKANGGVVLLTARAAGDLAATVINHTGIIEAQTLLTGEQGQITLLGEGAEVKVSGTLDASASNGDQGGRIVATGTRVMLEDSAHLTASGKAGGGEVLVGGSYQNSDPSVYQATGTIVKAGAKLEANATDTGKGGTVVAWSDITNAESVTRAYGTFEAKGGANGGDGGRIETSGRFLGVEGIRVDATAPQGKSGEWLLDPYNITIAATGASGTAFSSSYTPSATSTILASSINTALDAGTNVTVSTGLTGSAGADAGNITVSTAISATGAGALSLTAANTITLNADITTGGAQSYTGAVVLGGNRSLTTTNSDISFSSTVNATSSGAQSLMLNQGSGLANFNGIVGGSKALASLAVNGSGATYLGGSTTGITTSGAQSYAGNLYLGAANTSLTSSGNGAISVVGDVVSNLPTTGSQVFTTADTSWTAPTNLATGTITVLVVGGGGGGGLTTTSYTGNAGGGGGGYYYSTTEAITAGTT
jgi:filamentous hemagglutinin family protein